MWENKCSHKSMDMVMDGNVLTSLLYEFEHEPIATSQLYPVCCERSTQMPTSQVLSCLLASDTAEVWSITKYPPGCIGDLVLNGFRAPQVSSSIRRRYLKDNQLITNVLRKFHLDHIIPPSLTNLDCLIVEISSHLTRQWFSIFCLILIIAKLAKLCHMSFYHSVIVFFFFTFFRPFILLLWVYIGLCISSTGSACVRVWNVAWVSADRERHLVWCRLLSISFMFQHVVQTSVVYCIPWL